MGAEAVLALLDAKPGTPACVIALDGNQIVRVPLMQAVEMVRADSLTFTRILMWCDLTTVTLPLLLHAFVALGFCRRRASPRR